MSKDAAMRWNVIIWYRSRNDKSLDVAHSVEELADVHDLVERGPDWNTIEKIEITLARKCERTLTLEDAEERNR